MTDYAMERSRFGLYFLRQNKGYEYTPYQQEGICLALEQLEKGTFADDGSLLAIHAPPRMGKSETCSVCFPSWYLGRHPDKNAMIVSGSGNLAVGFGRKTRNLIESPTHAAIFPDSRIEWDSRAKDDFSLTEGGHYYAMGFDGQITGKGAHLLVIDDPVKSAPDAQSEAAEAARRDIFDSAIFPRLEPHAIVLLVMTIWPGDAFSGWLMEKFGRKDITREELQTWRFAA